MRSDASDELPYGVIGRRSDAGLFKDLTAHVCIGNAEQVLLLLRALRRWQARGQEILQRWSYFVLGDSHNILERFLGGLEGMACRELDHFGKSFEAQDGLLNLWQLTTGLVELLFLEEAVPGGTLVQNEKLRHSDKII